VPPILVEVWTTFFFNPMLNGLVVLYQLLFNNFALAVVVFTILVRLLMLPLTLRQLRASKAMSQLQPKIAELQKKHGKDREGLAREQMRLYKEEGVNPLGCAAPTLLQMPIWIGLYQSITYALAATPEGLAQLSQHLYPGVGILTDAVPLKSQFLWLNLAQPDPTYLLPILVTASMFIQQKMMTMPSADPQQASMNRTMLLMMPLMFGFFTISFASGLAIYWLTSNLISIALQYWVTGWGSLFPLWPLFPPPPSAKPDDSKKNDRDRQDRKSVAGEAQA
jgi:YidC/Oxa1 family membrane protein insertase